MIALGTEKVINNRTYVAVYDSSAVCNRCSLYKEHAPTFLCVSLQGGFQTLCSDNNIVWIKKK